MVDHLLAVYVGLRPDGLLQRRHVGGKRLGSALCRLPERIAELKLAPQVTDFSIALRHGLTHSPQIIQQLHFEGLV